MNYHLRMRMNISSYFTFIPGKRISGIIILLIFTGSFSFCFSQSHPATDDEFVGPFPSWINVKTQFGAVGDGVADETAALQAAFDAIGKSNSTASVVYLPAGTYRITGTLMVSNKISISIIGADPATTKIIWDGSGVSGTMININGVAYSRFNRITWDGANKAAIAIDQSWDGTKAYFDTGNEYADDEFKNVGIGIRGGVLGYGFAETAIMRCKFTNNTVAGITLGNFNALDVWVWNSIFSNCAIGITNTIVTNGKSGAGNFKVYNSIFRNSTNSDIIIGDTGEFAFRDNTSTNSQAFLKATLKPYPCHITLQSNTIIDPISNKAIDILNHGPVILLDNIIRSRAGATAPVVSHSSYPNSDFFSMGNTFTVANPIQSGGRNIIYDKPIVSVSSLSSLTEQTLPGTQPNLNRTVFEVSAGANATTIQAIINQATLLTGSRPVVHFSFGTYNIQSTLNIPANSDMQIVGDGGEGATHLMWVGDSAGIVFNVEGPSKVTMRDLLINGNNWAKNISISNIDQVNSRIFMHELEGHINGDGLLVNGLDNTVVLAINSRFSAITGKAINVIGGALAANGKPQHGRTIMYGGLEWENNLSHEVSNGGNLLIRDVWYESGNNGPYLHLADKGIFTVDGSSVASPRGTAKPQISITNFAGKAAFINSWFQDRIAISGNGSETKVLGLGTVFGDNVLPVGPSTNTYIENTTSPAGDIRSFNSRSYNNPNSVSPKYGSFPVNDIGTPDSTFFATMLENMRNVHAQVLTSLPSGISDVRFYRVWLYKGLIGLELRGLLPSHTSLYFRTKQSGNWNDVNTWESSSDNTAWTVASVVPDYNVNTISIRNGHTVTVTSDIIIDQTEVNPEGALIISGCTLTVTNTLTASGLTLQSNATGSARIGNSTGTILGNVTVERYTSNKRAWRLLGIPFSSSSQTIKASWMEGASNSSANPNNPYGTHITTFAGDPNAANYDAIKPASSIRIYSDNSFNPDAVHTPNTTNAITANPAYFLFVRGDRSVDRTSTNASSAATLRISGTVTSGNVTRGVTGANFSLIPNPYPSPIDFDALKSMPANSSINKIYVWDAKLGAIGQYRTIDITGTGPNYNYTATPGSSNNNWRFIESGTAFFIAGNRTVDFTETTKSSGIPPSSVLRTTAGTDTELIINLNTVNPDNTTSLADGVRLVFNNNYSASIDNDDAKKIIGFDVNLGIASNNEILSIEKRPLPKSNDAIVLSLSNAIQGSYQFEVQPVNFSSTALYAHLKDNYLNTVTPVSLNTDTKINFSITTDPASAGANRFSIVFTNRPPVQSNKSFILVYPNPVKDGLIHLQFNIPKGDYNIKLVNSLGQIILTEQIFHGGGPGSKIIQVVKNIKGIYHLEIIKPDNSKFSSNILVD